MSNPLAESLRAERPVIPDLRAHIEKLRAAENEYTLREQRKDLVRLLTGMGAPLPESDLVCNGVMEDRYPLKKAIEWSSSGKSILLLLGGNGAGKTVASVWLMSQRMCTRRINVPGDVDESGRLIWVSWKSYDGSQFFTHADYLASASSSSFSDAGARQWSTLINAGLLVIDEIGGELSAIDKQLTKVLQVRLSKKNPTILISNKSPIEFAKDYGDRIAIRAEREGMLVECGSAI